MEKFTKQMESNFYLFAWNIRIMSIPARSIRHLGDKENELMTLCKKALPLDTDNCTARGDVSINGNGHDCHYCYQRALNWFEDQER